MSFVVLQLITIFALMIQSYIVTEDDNTRINADREDFNYLVAIRGCAICGKDCNGFIFDVVEVIEVSLNSLVVIYL